MSATPQHESLAAGRWFALSFFEQMGNIGSEVHRAMQWQERNQDIFNRAINNALELIDMSVCDARWRSRLKELLRARELLCEAAFGERSSDGLADLDEYFLSFAMLARGVPSTTLYLE